MRRFPGIFFLVIIMVFSVYTSLAQEMKDSLSLDKLLEKAEYNTNRNPSLSIDYAIKALEQSEEKSLERIKAYYYLGYGHYIKNNYDTAASYLNRVLDLAGQTQHPEWEALAMNRLGNAFQLKGSYDKALEMYQKALELNQKLEQKDEIARSLTNVGSIYRTVGNFDKAIQFHLQALAKYEDLEAKEGIAWTSLNIARLFKLNTCYDKALEYLDKS